MPGFTEITITGTALGLATNDTTVDFGGSECQVTAVSVPTITCVTTAHAAETVPVTVTTLSVSLPALVTCF